MIKINWPKAIPYIIIIIMGIIIYYYVDRSGDFKEKYQTEQKLTKALQDTATKYINKNKELVTEKLTLQTDVKNLTDENYVLTESQNELIDRVKEVERKNTIITAALVQSQVTIDSLLGATIVVDTSDNTVTVADSTEDIQYEFVVGKVKPVFFNQKPTFVINKLYLPNKQFIEFHWKNDKKEGYPISFSVSNSNKYFKTTNIDSYAIPELQKPKLKPTFWQRAWKGIKASSPYLVGGAIGAGAMYIIKN